MPSRIGRGLPPPLFIMNIPRPRPLDALIITGPILVGNFEVVGAIFLFP